MTGTGLHAPSNGSPHLPRNATATDTELANTPSAIFVATAMPLLWAHAQTYVRGICKCDKN